jgi:hypothetical protein
MEPRSDVDRILGIAKAQDCRDDLMFATPVIRTQYAKRPVTLTSRPNVLRYPGRVGIPFGRWAIAFDACTDCGRSDRHHQGHGLCTACYMRIRYRGQKRAIWEGVAA